MSGSTREFEANTEQEAVQKACRAVNLTEQELDYTVMDEGSSGLLGIGARPVRIKVRIPEGTMVKDKEEGLAEEPQHEDNDESDAEEAASGIIGPAPEKAARAKEVAEGLAARMGLEAQISVRDEDAQIVVVIEEAEGSTAVAEMLGRSRPPAIPSFQFLLNKIVNRFPQDRKHIIVEVPSVPRKERRGRERSAEPRQDRGPRESRPQAPVEPDPNLDPTLVELAKRLADKALRLGKVITVHPMTSGDRRAFHQTVMTIEGVSTLSQGDGLYRRMHIVPDSLLGESRGPGGGKRRRRRRRRRGPQEEGGASPENEQQTELGGEDGPDEDRPDAQA